MTDKVLTLTSGAVVLLMIGSWLAASSAKPIILRSKHSDPAMTALPALVAVTTEGKLYHDPACAFIHGPIRIEPSEQAVGEGYTPCTRCLKRYGRDPQSSHQSMTGVGLPSLPQTMCSPRSSS
jgi:hypothetical protein